MNTNSNAVASAQPSEAPAPIVPASQVAPVVESGLAVTVPDAAVEHYCNRVVAGKPTGKIFPHKLSEITFTAEQREAIRAARATHRLNCMAGKREFLAKLRSKSVQFIGSRENAKGSRGAVRWADEKVAPLRYSEIFGADPKPAK